jgi:hypothetical protein
LQITKNLYNRCLDSYLALNSLIYFKFTVCYRHYIIVYMKAGFFYFIILLAGACIITSCQKELDGLTEGLIIIPAAQKPKVGTIWTYRFYTYHSYGGLSTSKILTYKAKTEETIGGEKWLRLVDMANDTTVYLMNTKAGGLYQYTNSNAYLLCKYPATLGETYNTFNEGATEDFTVKGVNDSLDTGLGIIPFNYYEGVKGGDIIDLVWYNNNAWIIWKYQYYKGPPPANRYFLYSKMFIDNIVY